MEGPYKYSRELFADICETIASGSTVTKACAQHGITRATFYGWMRNRNNLFETSEVTEMRQLYQIATEERADALFDEIFDISDDDSLDLGFSEEGKPFVRGEHIQRSRLRVDTRKWAAGKLNPKKYGDALKLQGDSDQPLQVVIQKFRQGESDNSAA